MIKILGFCEERGIPCVILLADSLLINMAEAARSHFVFWYVRLILVEYVEEKSK